MPHRLPVALLAATASVAAAEPLVTDRPDFTESTSAVAVGRLQIELGYTAVVDDDRDEHFLPETLLRIGVVERTELRLGWGGVRIDEGGVDGTDSEIGFKHVFDLGDDSPLGLGFIAALSLPTGGSDATDDVVVPGFKFLWSYDLADSTSIAGNINLALPESEAGDRIGLAEASLALAHSLTEQVGTYVEYFGLYPWEQDALEHYVNGGFTFLLSDDLQLDVRVGAGLNDSADDLFAGVGLSVRF